MDSRYLVFALGTSILFFIYLYLSYLVIIQRRKHRVAFLTNDNLDFIARFRAHANFSEYVPYTLILMGIAIVLGMSLMLFSTLMVLLVIARIIHAVALIRQPISRKLTGRVLSVTMTFSIMIILAFFNLTKALIILCTT